MWGYSCPPYSHVVAYCYPTSPDAAEHTPGELRLYGGSINATNGYGAVQARSAVPCVVDRGPTGNFVPVAPTNVESRPPVMMCMHPGCEPGALSLSPFLGQPSCSESCS